MIEPDRMRIRAALETLAGGGDAIEDGARRAAVAILLRGVDLASAEVLLMRRAQRPGDRWSGHIGLPGGHEEDQDTDLVATARRESIEEVGVDPGEGEGQLFGALPPVQARAGGKRLPLYVVPYVFHRADPPEPVTGPEAAEAFWMPLELASSGRISTEHPFERGGLVHRLPAWDFEGRRIWGMTHGILDRFLTALGR